MFCELFWMSSVWLFDTLVPCAVFGMCFVGFVVMLLCCALFCMCSVWLFCALARYALFWMCSVRFVVTLVSCALFWICCVWLFHASSSYTVLHVFCLIVFHVGCLCIGLCVLHCSLVRLCLAHSYKCVLKSFSYVSVLRTVLKCVVHDCLVR